MKNNTFDLSTADGRVRQWLCACLESINHKNSDKENQAIGELADTLKITYAELDAFFASIKIDGGEGECRDESQN